MSKRLMGMLLISVLLFSCISLSISAVERPIVSIDNIQCPANQSTADLIYVPIRTTAFTENVTTIGLEVAFDNTKLVYDKTCKIGNIPVLDGTVPPTIWVKHNATAEANANTTGKMTFLCDNPLDNPYVNSGVVPGSRDILYYISFKKKEGATGRAYINITNVTYDTDKFVTYSNKTGDIDLKNGSIAFGEGAKNEPVSKPVTTPQPTEPVTRATPVPTAASTVDVTVSLDDEKGMIINKATGRVIKNGEKVSVVKGATANFEVVAYGGYKLVGVSYNDGVVAGTGMFKYSFNTGVVDANMGIVATFSDFAPANLDTTAHNQVFKTTENGEKVAVIYETIPGLASGGVCGIILWNTQAGDVTLQEAIADANDGIQVFSATGAKDGQGINTLGQFGVKVVNLKVGEYKMKTYVVKGADVSYGAIMTFSVA